MNIPENVRNEVLRLHRSEITAYHNYWNISEKIKDEKNAKIIIELSEEEQNGHDIFKSISQEEVKPSQFTI